jgi:excinuclease ABC subunit B
MPPCRAHKITPKTIVKAVQALEEFATQAKRDGLALLKEGAVEYATAKNLPTLIEQVERQMREAADNLDFETAAVLRDQLAEMRQMSAQRRGGKTPAAKKGGALRG